MYYTTEVIPLLQTVVKPIEAEPNSRLYTFSYKAYLPNCMLIRRTVQEIRCQIM